MLVFGIDCKIEIEFVGFVVMNRIGSDEPPAFYVCAIVVAGAVDSVQLLCMVSVIKIVRNGMKHKEELVGETDVVAYLVVGVSQVDPSDFLRNEGG